MKIALWRSQYETGFSIVDQQHQHLFDIINRLHEAMSMGHGREVIEETLEEMLNYTVEHFSNEEKLMVKANYPLYPEHKKIHDQLTQEVREMSEKVAKQEHLVTVKVSHFLTQWLIQHIKIHDVKMIRFLHEQKVIEKINTPV